MKPSAVTGRLLAIAAAVFVVLAATPLEAARAVAAGLSPTGMQSPAPESIQTAHFAEALVRTAPTSAAEDEALIRAVASYERRARPEDLTSLTEFVAAHPRSGWTAALLTNLGLSYLHDGYFSRAIDAWRGAWRLGKGATDPRAMVMVDGALGELIRLQASLGQFNQVEALFKEMDGRPVTGSATEAVQQARELLTLTTKNPRHLFNCGPVGLELLMLALDPRDQRGEFLQSYRIGPKGASLAQLDSLADQARFQHRLVFRAPGQPVPSEGLVHWKVGHYSAIVGKANGRFHLKDPIFPGSELWVTEAALNAEASGYFLIPANVSPDPRWRIVAATEAAKVWGKGPTSGTAPGSSGARDKTAHSGGCRGMCVYDLREATVGVTISDTPVGYQPPVGPNVTVSLTYNQREDSQPANASFFNVGTKWTLDWLAYITDDPTNPGANVSRYLVGGGAYYYAGYNAGTGQFSADQDDGSVLVRTTSGPVSYQRQQRDGSVEIYAQADGAASYPRKLFLTRVIDPQGNAVVLNYDGQMRLTSLTDATGRQTTFAYGMPASPLLVTQITDPFGRSAVLAYDGWGRLSSIADVIGLTSSVTYDSNWLVSAITTPYGTTTFSYTAPGASGPPRFVNVTDPMGYHERLEWLEPAPVPDSDPVGSVPQGMPLSPVNQYLTYRDTFYWDKIAYALAGCTPTGGCDYSKAVDTHFLHGANTSIKSTTPESVKYPLENRAWYNYPGQTSSAFEGTGGSPIAAGRVLDDGSTQLYKYTYDTSGFFNLTQQTDPLGRVTTYTYDTNHIDLTDVTQLTAGGVQASLAHVVYNTHHRPTSATDAAGQATAFGYNAAQQLTSITNPLNQVTTFSYNTSGDLTSVTNANNQTAATYTYDAFDRVATYADSQGWTVSYNYDAADRLTKATYPDGTSESYAYDKLDLASYQDRIGRKWVYTHDANRRLTAVTDPIGRQRQFAYNGIGEAVSQTDANSHLTQWAYDVQGRLTTKTYADNTTQTFAYETTTSRLKSATDALNQVKQYSYAKDNRLAGVTYAGAINPTPNVSYAYDPYFPRVATRSDGLGTTQFAYVPAGSLGALRVQQETTPYTNGAITYVYDALGRVGTRTVQGSAAETLTYDAINRLTGDANDLGSFTLGYLGQTGQIASRQLAAANVATTWSYLANVGDRRLASVSTTGMAAGQFTTFQYASNSDNQATGVTQTSDAAIAYPPTSFTQTASFNNLNELTSLSGQALTWDANGNLTSDGTRTYSWDAENRLVAIGYPGQPGKATSFAYDGLGRRVTITSTPAGGAAVTTSYLWCGWGPCQARVGNTMTRAYYSEGEYVPGSPAQALYYAPDQIGSVRRVFAATQAPAYDFDAYGNRLQGTAPITDFGYAGLFNNVDSGLYLATYRAYDPVAGRWISRDPIGEIGDLAGNLYGYVGQDPVGGLDPAGTGPIGATIGGEVGAWVGGLLGGTGGAIGGTAIEPIGGTIAGGVYGGVEGAEAGGAIGSIVGSGLEDFARAYAKAHGGKGSGKSGAAGAAGARGAGGQQSSCPPGSGGRGPGGNGAGGSPSINPQDLAGKTASEIDAAAKEAGLVPKGPSPETGQGSYDDPVTGEQRVLSHPNADPPHFHVNDPSGARLDINGNVVHPKSTEAHLPLKQ